MKIHWPRFHVVLLTFFILPSPLYADPSMGFLEEDVNLEDILEDIPGDVRLKTVSRDELTALPYFTTGTARRFIEYRDTLSVVESLSDTIDTLNGLSPFQRTVLSYLSRSEQLDYPAGFKGSFRSGLVYRAGNAVPFTDINSDGYYFKIRAGYTPSLMFSFIVEHDQNEPRAFDLSSGHAAINLNKNSVRIIMGDYRPEFGQGLVFSRYTRRYFDMANCQIARDTFSGNASFEESRFLRGVFLSIQRGFGSVQFFSSRRTLDATLDDEGDAVSISTSGNHYSSDERDNLTEYVNVIRLSLTGVEGISFGLAGTQTKYYPALSRRNDERHLLYPKGSVFTYISFDGGCTYGPVHAFFEHAGMVNGEHASTAGFRFETRRVQSCFLLREYSEAYWSYHSGGFSSFGNMSNERGLYAALQSGLTHSSQIAVSMDLARTLSRTFTEKMPVSRLRLGLLLKTKIRGRLKGTIIARSTEDSGDLDSRWNCRMVLEKGRSRKEGAGWRTLAAWSEGGDKGGVYAEAGFFCEIHGVSMEYSAGYFDIPSYKARFYRYEHDVPGRGMTMPVWGRGMAVTIVARVKFLSLRCRLSDSTMYQRINEYAVQSDLMF